MLYLKQSTASQSVLLGPFVDDTDGVTAETGLTIANTDIRLSANGGNMFAKTSGGGTHDENGYYTITLDATDTATVGRLQISCKVSGALAVWMDCHVLEESVYDALFAASAPGYLQPTTAGRTLDVTATGAAGIDWGNVENQSTAVDLSATDIQLADTVTTLTGHTAQTGDSYARIGAPAGASVSADVAAVKSDTAAILVDTADMQPKLGTPATDVSADIAAVKVDTAATLVDTAEIGAAGAGLTVLATAANLATAQADLDTITAADGVFLGTTQPTGWAANLEASAGQIIKCTVDTVTNTHTPTTTEFQCDDVTEATADHFNGRIVVFTSGVLAGQATNITDYAAVGGIGQFTVTALTEAPSNNDTLVIL